MCIKGDCHRKDFHNQMCGKHYQESLDPNREIKPRPARDSTPWEKVLFHGWEVTETECWEFDGPKNGAGYGTVMTGGKSQYVHRLSYEAHIGPIPPGEGYYGTVIRHKCDNPPCINPDHLLLGTQQENLRDAVSRGRFPKRPGAENSFSKLTPEDVKFIRRSSGRAVVLAEQFKVHRDTIHNVRSFRTYRVE